jgi:hypothetical protein
VTEVACWMRAATNADPAAWRHPQHAGDMGNVASRDGDAHPPESAVQLSALSRTWSSA